VLPTRTILGVRFDLVQRKEYGRKINRFDVEESRGKLISI
jgi:hypothetical protein